MSDENDTLRKLNEQAYDLTMHTETGRHFASLDQTSEDVDD